MRDTMMTTLPTGQRVMWGGLNTSHGSRAAIMLFGINLGSSMFSTSLARHWTISNSSNDVYFPAVSILDNGLALAAYTVSGALRPSSAYSVFSTTMAPAAIQVSNVGQGLQDGFTQYDADHGLLPPALGRLLGSCHDGELDLLHERVHPDAELLAGSVHR